MPLSLDEYNEGRGKRGRSTHASIVLSPEQVAALKAVLLDAQADLVRAA